ncbi:PucR family transcriptional regulator [Aeromicrobium sp. CTD01-1L150]|uniref:PucR family transcriptional regulator n=1 Tax=Aeromicrobium sp. CTD01-1L150 TaxID=3341830 RepID=UPI0035C173B5
MRSGTSAVTHTMTSVGALLSEHLEFLTGSLQSHLADQIEELNDDRVLLDLLYGSIESNLEALAHILRYDIPITEVTAPAAAQEYARRLAQHGVSVTALIRAYRLAQAKVVDWVHADLVASEPDLEVVINTSRRFTEFTFAYIDNITEQVIGAYEAERDRWMSHRSTLRAAMVERLVGGTAEIIDVDEAERALGYRLRQRHVGVVLWADGDEQAGRLRSLEYALTALAERASGSTRPLFLARDGTYGWGWLPLGRREDDEPDAGTVAATLADIEGVRVALGSARSGLAGFRLSHEEAEQARQVALVAGDAAPVVTTFAETDVRTAAMLVCDLAATRRLVTRSLGELAVDTAGAARLRETLRELLRAQGSYTAAAGVLHLHKNTVKYRVDRALALRGRPLEEARMEMELALVACAHLGPAVLS